MVVWCLRVWGENTGKPRGFAVVRKRDPLSTAAAAAASSQAASTSSIIARSLFPTLPTSAHTRTALRGTLLAWTTRCDATTAVPAVAAPAAGVATGAVVDVEPHEVAAAVRVTIDDLMTVLCDLLTSEPALLTQATASSSTVRGCP